MTTATAPTVGPACDLAGVYFHLQCQQQGIRAAARVRHQRPGFFGAINSAHLDYADAQNRVALDLIGRDLSQLPAAND
jgi:hypothetical protein